MPFRQHRWHDKRTQMYCRLLRLNYIRRMHYGEKAPDGQGWATLEVKCRERLPAIIRHGLAQAAQRGTGIPLLILHELRKSWEDDVVCLRLGDFLKICQPPSSDSGQSSN